MTRMMPVPDLRGCASCSHVWFTADFRAGTCPACLAPTPDISAGQLHVCSSGHDSYLDGPCWRCEQIAKEREGGKVREAEQKEWRNRG